MPLLAVSILPLIHNPTPKNLLEKNNFWVNRKKNLTRYCEWEISKILWVCPWRHPRGERADLMTGLLHLFHPNGWEFEQITRMGQKWTMGPGWKYLFLGSLVLAPPFPVPALLRFLPALTWAAAPHPKHGELRQQEPQSNHSEQLLPQVSWSHRRQCCPLPLCCENRAPPVLHLLAHHLSNFCP